MALRQIPLTAYPDTSQQSDLDGVTYNFRFRWSERGQAWHMDLRTLDGDAIVLGARLVNDFPLMRRVQKTSRPPGELFLLDVTGRGEDPNFDDFGARYCLFYIEAVAADGGGG
jgi:hypothetical protein